LVSWMVYHTKMTTRSRSNIHLFSGVFGALSTLWRDVQYAVRQTTKTPVFLIGAIVSIALGIGASACILSLFKATMLDRLVFRDPDRIIIIRTTPPSQPTAKEGVSVPDYFALKEHSELFDKVGAFQTGTSVVGFDEGGRQAEQLTGQSFTASLFAALDVAPLHGRVIAEADDRMDEPSSTAVISRRLWQNRFGGAPDVIGKTVILDGKLMSIAGVMPPGFGLLEEESDYWLPMNFSSVQLKGTSRFLTVVARLKPGVSFQQAQAKANVLAAELAQVDPARNKGRGIHLETLGDAYFGEIRQLLLTLEGGAAIILLLTCANLAGLLLIRASHRRREVAIRCSLGADRLRILRQFLTESLLLSLIGGLLGVALAAGGLQTLFANKPAWLSNVQNVGIDLPTLVAAVVLSVVTGVAFGIGPALRIAKSDIWNTLKENTTSLTGNRRLQRALVAAQIAFALMLLVNAGLVIKSFARLQSNDLGFEPKQLLSFETRVAVSQYIKFMTTDKGRRMDISPLPAALFDQVRQRLRALPGIESVAGINLPPLSGSGLRAPFEIEGRKALTPKGESDPDAFNAGYYLVTPGFFTTMRMKLLQGRDFSESDGAHTQWVAVINEAMAKRYWPGENPIGQNLRVNIVPEEQPRQIIGIVRDIPVSRWDNAPTPMLYVSHLQQPNLSRPPYGGQRVQMTFLARLSGDSQSVAPFLSRAVSDVNTNLPVTHVRMMEEYLARQIDTPRYYMLLLGGFGVIAMIIAATGVYGVIAYSVAQRSREIAVRVALGAQKSQVLTLIMRESLLLISTGFLLGIAGALALTRFVREALWGVTSTDPAIFIAVPMILLIVMIVATLAPASRALRLDPREVMVAE
jgi:putative ABC transport system permease protein